MSCLGVNADAPARRSSLGWMAEDQPGLSDGEDDIDEVDDAPGLLLASEGFWAELRGQTPGTQVSFRRPYYAQVFLNQYQQLLEVVSARLGI